jgi:hypothetical protein
MWSFARYVHHYFFDNFYQIVGPVDALRLPVGLLIFLFGLLNNLPFDLPLDIV